MMGPSTVEDRSGSNSFTESLQERALDDFERHKLQPVSLDRQKTHLLGSRPGASSLSDNEDNASSDRLSQSDLTAVSTRIYVLGGGNLGKFIAHSLASIVEPPPVSLLLHSHSGIEEWYDEGRAMEVIGRGGISDVQRRIDVEWTKATKREVLRSRLTREGTSGHQDGPETYRIHKLIVTLPTTNTVRALYELRHRLGPSSTICFIQNTMGLLEEINEKVFPNALTRPRYMIAMSNHLIGSSDRVYTTVKIRDGELVLSLLPGSEKPKSIVDRDSKPLVRPASFNWTSSSRSLMRILTRTLALETRALNYKDMFLLKMERLAVDALIGPLSVVFQCSNEDLLHNHAVDCLVSQVLDEIVTVIHALPEMRDSKWVDRDVTFFSLKKRFVGIAKATAKELSSMLQDVKVGRKTEIDYVNGYFVKRSEELGIQCPVNRALIEMVKARQAMTSRKENGYIPFQERI